MDPPGRVPKRTQDEWDDRGRRRSEWAINLPGSDDRRDGSEGAEQSTRPRQHSITSGHLPRQVSASSTRQKGSQPESRLEDRRGLAQRLHIFPYRPHSSNASRNSSANTSSSSLPSLGENSAAEGNESTSYFGTSPSHNMHASRASESSHMPPLSPLSEHPPLTTTVSGRSGDYPVYPNQSYAVLQNQVYPPPHQPLLRTRSSYSSHHSLSAGPTAPSWYSRDPSSRPQGARTAGNTPISSPGLFSTHRPNSPSIGSDDFRVSYLHPTHLQEPKETHTVEVDRDMLTGNKLINEYEILDELGRGEHGKVKLGRHLRTGQKVAIKIVQRYSKRRRLGKLGNPEDKVKKEVAILKKARHPNVVSLLEVIDDPNRQKVYIVLEFVENGEILWRRKGLKEIVTVDKRRLEREKRGIPDSASFIEESQQFVRASQLRRQRRDRARKKKMSAMSHYSGVPAWSLEHGGESDDDVDPEFASLHPTSTSTTVVDAPVAHITPNHSFTSASDFESRMREYAMEAMEGSMYGPYAAESLDRRYSTASSNLGYQTSEADWQSDDDDLSYVPCLTLAEARSAFRDAVLGLEYLHYQGIIHRDIKPANLLVTATSRVKISDFGVSYLGRPLREEDEEQVTETDATELDDARELSKTVGTPAFYAPELCYTGTEFETTIGRVPKITGAIDVWSLGVTLYGMIFGRLPFVSDDEFGLFQHIVKHSVFIPTRRLKAVEPPPPPGAGSMPRVMNSNKRMEDELVYEDIDDELCDLLSRLLVKDPTKRITLKEIKYHPWVLRDIPDPKAWVEETDPGYQSKGKRIEVSNDEVTRAVTKMPFIERVRSNVARWGGNIFSRSRDSRRRAPSSANSGETLNSASSTSSVTIGRDLIREIRRASLRGDEEVNSRTPKSGKDGEHPLSQSVLASPEIKDDSSYFGSDGASKGDSASSDHPTRPELPERATPVFSSTTSSKTVRPSGPSATVSSDLAKKGGSSSASSGLGGIFSGAGLRLARGLHTGEWRRERSRSTDRSVDGDGHSGPSVAISSASATGQVQSPDVLRNPSSTSLVSTNSQNSTTTGNPPSPRRRNRSQTLGHKSSAESLQYIRDPLQRQRRQQQDYFQNARPAPSEREREIYPSDRRHPRDHQNQTDGSSAIEYNRAREPSDPQDPITSPPSAVTMSSSSADDFTSGMSHSASHPSIPSVVSGASSLSADGFHSSCLHEREQKDVDASGHVPPLLRTGDTVKARPMHHDERAHEDESKYDCDDEDEYESEDEGIVFGKKTSSCSGGPTRV